MFNYAKLISHFLSYIFSKTLYCQFANMCKKSFESYLVLHKNLKEHMCRWHALSDNFPDATFVIFLYLFLLLYGSLLKYSRDCNLHPQGLDFINFRNWNYIKTTSEIHPNYFERLITPYLASITVHTQITVMHVKHNSFNFKTCCL